MNKKSLLIILPIICSISSLTSCANSRAITTFNNYDVLDSVFNMVNDNELITLIDTKQTFTLFVSESSCHTCMKVNEYFTKYIEDNHELVYKYEIDDQRNDYYYMQNKYPNIFDKSPALPDITFISEGEARVRLSDSKYSSEMLFKSALDEFLTISNMFYSSKIASADEFLTNNPSYILFLGSYKSSDTYNVFSNNIYPIVSKNRQSFLFIDIALEKSESLEQFKSKNNIKIDSPYYSLIYKDSKIVDAIDYLKNEVELNKLVSYL